jgi:hypothetical protein
MVEDERFLGLGGFLSKYFKIFYTRFFKIMVVKRFSV